MSSFERFFQRSAWNASLRCACLWYFWKFMYLLTSSNKWHVVFCNDITFNPGWGDLLSLIKTMGFAHLNKDQLMFSTAFDPVQIDLLSLDGLLCHFKTPRVIPYSMISLLPSISVASSKSSSDSLLWCLDWQVRLVFCNKECNCLRCSSAAVLALLLCDLKEL